MSTTTTPVGHYTVVRNGHIIVDGVHWLRFCAKCQHDLAAIAARQADNARLGPFKAWVDGDRD